MEKACDICGFKNPEDAFFCGGCGVDLRDNDESPEPIIQKKKTRSPKKDKDSENKKPEKVIKWCQIHSAMNSHQITFPLFINLFYQLAEGEKHLAFCDCNVCNLGYRELQTEYINLTENKKLKPNSREIVSRFHDADISKTIFDLSDFCERKSPKTGEDTLDKSNEITSMNDKISIQIDRNVMENLLINVFSSKKGQELIKESLK